MLFDTGRVSGTMERIFPTDTPPSVVRRASAGRTWVPTSASGVPRSRVGARGSVAVLFAILAMGIGLAASRLLPTSRPPALRAGVVEPVRVPAPAGVPDVDEPRPDIRLSVPPPIAVLKERTVAVPKPASRRVPQAVAVAPVVVARAPTGAEKPAGSVRTPHLTGEALVRALAQDVIDTRVLNEAILRDQAAKSRSPGSGD